MTRPAAKVEPAQPRMLDYANAAAYLGISVRSLKSLAAEGHVPTVAVLPHRVHFDRLDLDAYIERKKAGQ